MNAGDELTDALFENGLPRYQPEAQSVLDHGEASACKRGSASEVAADIFARFAGREGQGSLGSHLTTHTLHLALLKTCDGPRWDLDGTFPDGGITHFDEVLGAAMERVPNIAAKAAVSDDQRLPSR